MTKGRIIVRKFVRATRRWGIDLLDDVAGSKATWVWVAVIVVGLVASWWVAVDRASATDVARHLFYVPVVVAAVRFGLGAGLGVGLAAGLLAGPLVPLPAQQLTANGPAVWGPRLVFFVLVGVTTALLVELIQERQAQQLEVMQRAHEQRLLLIQTLSHEFRTPLTLIRGTAETLQQDDLEPDTRRRLTGMLRRSSNNLERLMGAVLAAAGIIEVDEAGPVRLQRIAEDVVLDLDSPHAQARVTVQTPEGWASGQQRAALCFVARELITNALKFSPDDQPVHVRFDVLEHGVRLVVRDQGPGLDAAAQQVALEPFQQLDASTTRERGGLGLGLFAVKRIVEEQDGTLSLSNHPDGGLVATVTLHADDPASPSQTAQQRHSVSPTNAWLGSDRV